MKDDKVQVISDELLYSIVQIVDKNNKGEFFSKGTGFVVTEDGLIATCSHVVQEKTSQEAGEPIPETIGIKFPSIRNERGRAKIGRAKIVSKWWSSYEKEDICVLKLIEPAKLPNEVIPVKLCSSSNISGHSFITWGYPLEGKIRHSEGTIKIKTPSDKWSGRSVIHCVSDQVSTGCSGAPLFDLEYRQVVGIFAYMDPFDTEGRLGRNAFAFTSEELVNLCHPLESVFEQNPEIVAPRPVPPRPSVSVITKLIEEMDQKAKKMDTSCERISSMKSKENYPQITAKLERCKKYLAELCSRRRNIKMDLEYIKVDNKGNPINDEEYRKLSELQERIANLETDYNDFDRADLKKLEKLKEQVHAFERMKRVLSRLSLNEDGAIFVDGVLLSENLKEYYIHYASIAQYLKLHPDDMKGTYEKIWDHGGSGRTFINDTESFENVVSHFFTVCEPIYK